MSLPMTPVPDGATGKPGVVSLPLAWAISQDSTANSPQTLTRAAESGKTHYITAIEVSISGAAAGNDVSIELRSGSTKKWKGFIGSGLGSGVKYGVVFTTPVELNVGEDANLVVAAGGTSVVTTANLSGFTA